MTIAISEILKQVALLSPDEQQELTTTLMEKTQQRARSANGRPTAAPPAPAPLVNEAEAEEDDDWLDTLVLKPIPPKHTYTIKVKLEDAGRLQPLRYDFSDFFDDEEEGES